MALAQIFDPLLGSHTGLVDEDIVDYIIWAILLQVKGILAGPG